VAKTILFPRKRRTRGHVIADLGVNHVERFIYAAGFTVERTRHDYGDDLLITTYDANGYVEQGRITVQVKSTERAKVTANGRFIALRLDVADIISWMVNPMPVLLVLYEATTRIARWVYVQRDLRSLLLNRRSTATATIRLPKTRRLGKRTIESARRSKNNILMHQIGSVDHG